METEHRYAGRIELAKSVRIMEEKLEEVVQQKKVFILSQEHPLVYTAGIKTAPDHIIGQVDVVKLRRGGSVTLHNPGQLVFYTVLPLQMARGGLPGYIRSLEEIVITYLKEQWQVSGFRHDQHTGVWASKGKISFIGLGAKRGAIYHGLCLNLTNDLNDYLPIKSCGLELPVTRVADETDRLLKSSSEIIEKAANDLFEIFRRQLESTLII